MGKGTVLPRGNQRSDRQHNQARPPLERANSRKLHPDQQERQAFIAANTPLGRIGEPEGLSHVAVFLAAPLASYITGAFISVDGGAHVLSTTMAFWAERGGRYWLFSSTQRPKLHDEFAARPQRQRERFRLARTLARTDHRSHARWRARFALSSAAGPTLALTLGSIFAAAGAIVRFTRLNVRVSAREVEGQGGALR